MSRDHQACFSFISYLSNLYNSYTSSNTHVNSRSPNYSLDHTQVNSRSPNHNLGHTQLNSLVSYYVNNQTPYSPDIEEKVEQKMPTYFQRTNADQYLQTSSSLSNLANSLPIPIPEPQSYDCSVTLDDIRAMKQLRITNTDSISEMDATIGSTTRHTVVNGKDYECRFKNLNTRPLVMNLPTKVNRHTLYALVDTGATISAINPKTIPLVADAIHKHTKIEPFRVHLSLEKGDAHYIGENVELLITIDNKEFLWRFFVAPSLSSDLILGMDWLKSYKVHISCHAMTLQLGVTLNNEPERVAKINTTQQQQLSNESRISEQITSQEKKSRKRKTKAPTPIPPDSDFHTSESEDSDSYSQPSSQFSTASSFDPIHSICKLRLEKSIILQPNSMSRIQVVTTLPLEADVIVRPDPTLQTNQRVSTGNCIIRLWKGKGNTYILNPTPTPVKLFKGLTISTCHAKRTI